MTSFPHPLVVDLSAASAGSDDVSTTTAPTPQDPTGSLSTDSTAITAGLGGFLVVFALGLAVWFLGRDLTRRLRRMGHAEQERVEIERQRRVQTSRQQRPGAGDGDEPDPIG